MLQRCLAVVSLVGMLGLAVGLVVSKPSGMNAEAQPKEETMIGVKSAGDSSIPGPWRHLTSTMTSSGNNSNGAVDLLSDDVIPDGASTSDGRDDDDDGTTVAPVSDAWAKKNNNSSSEHEEETPANTWKRDKRAVKENASAANEDGSVDEDEGELQATHISCYAKNYTNVPNLVSIGPHGIWCPVPKAGTSTVFGMIPGQESGQNRMNCDDCKVRSLRLLVKDGENQAVCALMADKRSFIVIRNPWDRMKSAFYDTFVEGRHHMEVPGFGKDPSFMQFLHYLEDLDKTDVNAWNPHVRPVSLNCGTHGANAFKFTRVIKLEENFDKEVADALRWAGLDVKTSDVDARHKSSVSISRRDFYAKNGGQSAVDTVAKIFKEDIEFGGYTFGH